MSSSPTIRPKTTVKLRAKANCPSHSLANVEIRNLVVPVERGGTNIGPTPTDTALAALIGCTNVIGHKCAKSLDISVGHFDISAVCGLRSAVCEFDRRGVTLAEEIDVPFQRIHLSVETSELVSQPDLDRLAAEVAKFCPLAKLFRQAGTEIIEEWTSSNN